MTAIKAYKWDQEGRQGIILCARQFMNSLADSSLEEIKALPVPRLMAADGASVSRRVVLLR